VALIARTASKLADLEADIKAKGGTAASFPTDISQRSALINTFAAIKEKFPESPIKVAIFNINSKWTVKPFLELTGDEFKGSVHNHIDAAFEFSQLAVRELEQAKGGTLIFTGATASMRGSAKFAALASGCFAVKALR
jgi:short-subunit dehydrogenase